MNTYTNKFNTVQSEKIKNFLQSDGALFDTVQYAQWRAKSKDFQAIYYNSGKFLIQGKDVSDISNKIEELLNITTKTISNQKLVEPNCGYDLYIGTDESGKGDFFGPLIIAGVQVNEELKNKFTELGIKDSKKLDDNNIKKLSAHIKNSSVHSVIVIMPAKYNELYAKFKNLNKLLAWGHARAIENILEKSPCEYALSDKFGDEKLIINALLNKGRQIRLDQRVRAESDIAVAAASIIARAEFVKRMDEMSEKYGINFPKGASSKVIEQGRLFINKHSKEELKNVAKMHFKTALELD